MVESFYQNSHCENYLYAILRGLFGRHIQDVLAFGYSRAFIFIAKNSISHTMV